MTIGYILFIVIPIAAVAYIVWDFRRKTAQRNAVSAGRLTELMGAVKEMQLQPQSPAQAQVPLQPPVQSQAPPQPPPEPAVPPQQAPAPVAAPARDVPVESEAETPALYASRPRVLDAAQTLVYLLLRTGLPDHVVLARVSLASILEAGPGLSGIAREEQARRLATLTVDFVVADRQMRPVVVVEIAVPNEGSAAQADRSSARTRLAAAGVRYVELDTRALPRKEGIRAVVLDELEGAGAPAGAAH